MKVKVWEQYIYSTSTMNINVNGATKNFASWDKIKSYFVEVGKDKIVSLDFCGNHLSEIVPGIFKGLTSLRVLSLYNNQLSEIAPDTFEGLTSLQTLTLDNNQLSEIAPGTFEGLTSLRVLWLYNNQLSEIAPGTFKGLTSLQELSLRNNQLSEISPGTFEGLTSLHVLWFGGNHLSKIAPGTFEELTSLQVLWLYDNQLCKVPDGVHKKCKIMFHPQRVVLIKEYKQIHGEEDVVCSVSYDPIGDGCEYRVCSNPVKQHYILSEHWESWKKACGGSDKCIVCKEYDIVPKIFINTISQMKRQEKL